VKTTTITLTIAAVALAGAACTSAPSASTATPAATDAAAVFTYPTRTQPLPTPNQFSIGITILKKQCYDVFGWCNITYRIDPNNAGPGPIQPDKPIMVIYQVDGDKSGPTLNNFTVDTAGNAHFQSQEIAVVPIGVTLKAHPISVTTAN
jgi:hypothetical protein